MPGDLKHGRVVIAGVSLAGLRASETPREEVFTGSLTMVEDAGGLAERPAARPKRVLVIGGGFTGSEIASACRERGLEVTVAERGPAPLMGVPGDTLPKPAAVMPRNHGVDLRTGVAVTALRGNGSFTGAELSDGSRVDARICASWHWAR
ncbi:FAD-dependent oxidoreductase [Streptomyces mirabilis]|uniref:FAD-dependent oxidoreductase n=1 Tax=Streptomyces mirabilis TaxID=68239 RepID=UPI0036BBF760